jgi:dimethylhistidine N-methyltransferase
MMKTQKVERLRIKQLNEERKTDNFAEDARAGLTADPKYLFPKYFYDPLGSKLFEAITLLPEYYPTRAETEILRANAGEIVNSLKGEKQLLEFGSGSATKTRFLIEAILQRQNSLKFMPIDISASALAESSANLLEIYPTLQVEAYAGDYFSALRELEKRPETSVKTLALFLGSNIGNFSYEEACDFLRDVRKILQPGDALLLGADLKKSTAILEAAYNDSIGVTAAFNLNLLARVNRELEADFDLHSFRHVAVYNTKTGCLEMYLESLKTQTAHLKQLDLRINFTKGERIHTENSYKYAIEDIAEMAQETGFELDKTWFDSERKFSSNLLKAREL